MRLMIFKISHVIDPKNEDVLNWIKKIREENIEIYGKWFSEHPNFDSYIRKRLDI